MNIQRKVCLLGSDGVGKTSIIVRYTKGTFSNSYLVTLGVDFYEVKFSNPKTSDMLSTQIWDLASQKNFQFMRAQYLSYANYIIIVVDAMRHADEYIVPWINDVRKHAGKEVPYIIVLNKVDLIDAETSKNLVLRLKNQFNVPIFNTSAKTGENVHEIFEYVAECLW
ncbi:Rab family GTPase [Candidatus Lokiarchaeum ossiferum]|uniref:Rab family GTPase n=1 Tax=Candidatus Lokiarchaeum ossiferum TaxID=2951803 RepID=UPI00352C8C7B